MWCIDKFLNSFNALLTRKRSSESRSFRSGFICAVSAALALFLVTIPTRPVQAQSAGRVLIVMSSAKQLQLQDGKVYATGYYLPELAIPLQKLLDAGYTPVFANPNGDTPNLDPASNNKFYFGNSEEARLAAVKLVESRDDLKHPKTLSQVLKEGTAGYVGIFVPGGHAPMQDLMQDGALGAILREFHASGRPTALLCHGPMALLSATSDPIGFRAALVKGDYSAAAEIARGWPYAGYRLTVFSSAEERVLEGPNSQLGGKVQFYPPDGLAQAGAHVDHVGLWQPNIVEDKEVVSGQQPSSSELLGDAFVSKLKSTRK